MYYRKRVKTVKVFISWSGDYSKKIAEILKDWIKGVIQSVEPFVSSEDIPDGSRWTVDIAKELQDTNFGILCVTKDNFQAPWLLYEAGALSKKFDDKSYVVPLLFGLDPSDLSDSPLLQFQAASFSKDGIKKLLDTVNQASEKKLDSHQLDHVFKVWYSELEKSLSEVQPPTITKKDEPSDAQAQEKSSQILEEILVLSRENQKLLRSLEGNTTDESKQKYDMVERADDYRGRA